MNVIALIISAIAVVAAAAAAFFSWRSASAASRSAKEAHRTMLHHVLEDIRKDYRSPEMYHAVKTIWEFYKDCKEKGEDFVEGYFKTLEKDNKMLANLEESQRIEVERNTLHYQRRLVSHFYQYVAALYANKILPKGIIFRNWKEEDLRIIPNILIPIETKLQQVVQTPQLQPPNENNLPDWLSTLYTLYKDSRDFYS